MSSESTSSPATPRIADRLAAARRGRFVGRAAELELFRSALLSDMPPFVVLHVFGPGGVGKTTLLQEYARVAAECRRPTVRLDARNLAAAPRAFVQSLCESLGLPPGDQIPRALPPDLVLLIDTYETIGALDGWPSGARFQLGSARYGRQLDRCVRSTRLHRQVQPRLRAYERLYIR